MKSDVSQKWAYRITIACLCAALAGCGEAGSAHVEQDAAIVAPVPSGDVSAVPLPRQQPEPVQEPDYCRDTAQTLLTELELPKSSESETARQIYNYLIANTYFADPVGLDIWRYRSEQKTLPTYVGNRSLSPIVYGVGSCEDFAAAMVVLLQECGIDAVYVAGYTLSYKGEYTDHAWVAANVEGGWYHFDPQLEQDIFSGGRIPYRFFMASDEEMLRDHLWGEALIRYCGGLATEQEIERIRREFSPPPCPVSGAKPEAAIVGIPEKPDIASLLLQIEEEQSAHPALEELRLNTDPPVLVKAQPLVGLN